MGAISRKARTARVSVASVAGGTALVLVGVFLGRATCGSAEVGAEQHYARGVADAVTRLVSGGTAGQPAPAAREGAARLPPLDPLKACPAPPKKQPVHRSQYAEDKLLYKRYFRGRTHGTFVEIGGLDGLRYSNSWYFEQSLCWRGVLIEGWPTNFASLQSNRPEAVAIGRAVCEKSGTVTFEGRADRANTATAGIPEHMDAGFKEKYNKKATSVEVCCERMGILLNTLGIPYINLLSIDVEGAEQMVLDTMDWTIAVEVMIVETDSRYMPSDKVESLTRMLAGHGLELDSSIQIRHSTVFVNRHFDKSLLRDPDAVVSHMRSNNVYTDLKSCIR